MLTGNFIICTPLPPSDKTERDVLVENRKERENIGGLDVDVKTVSKCIVRKEVYDVVLHIRYLRIRFSVHSLCTR